MIQSPLTASQVRQLLRRCYSHAPALTSNGIHSILRNKPDGIQGNPKPRETVPTLCDCGNAGFRRFGSDWECERCHRLRIETEGYWRRTK